MDRQEYIDLFQSEANEYLQILSQCALKLEEEPSHIESLREAFRIVHSLKGMAGTMGYQQIMEITHSLENLLEGLKSGAIVSSPLNMDVIFEGIDLLQTALINPEQNDPENKERVNKITYKIKHLCGLGSGEKQSDPKIALKMPKLEIKLDETEKETIRFARDSNKSVYLVKVTLAAHAPMKSVRAYMVLRILRTYGEIAANFPALQDLEDENFDRQFQVVLIVARPLDGSLREKLLNVTDVEKAETILWDEKELTELTTGQADSNLNVNFATSQGVNEKMVRVETTKLDQLVNLVGEMVVARTRVLELGRGHSEELDNLLDQLTQTISNLQETSMELRMVPIKQVFDRFPRMVRDISRSRGKKIHLQIEGEQTELDRSIINRLSDPLVHLIRNAIDHGIEVESEREARGKKPEGRILLRAHHEGNHIIVSVEDDGEGMDPEKIKEAAIEKGIISEEAASRLSEQEALNLIFAGGFSTSTEITDISGRGVGMDVVKTCIESLHGSIQTESRVSEMTRFTLRLPLTLAIIKSLLVKSAGQVLAIPVEGIRENIILEPSQIKEFQNNKIVNLRGEVICLHQLNDLLGFSSRDGQESSTFPVVIVEAGGKKAGLIVEGLIGQQEIMIKPLGNYFKDLPGIAGATILGDGRVTLIIDVVSLLP